jgi:hypothetical protein
VSSWNVHVCLPVQLPVCHAASMPACPAARLSCCKSGRPSAFVHAWPAAPPPCHLQRLSSLPALAISRFLLTWCQLTTSHQLLT